MNNENDALVQPLAVNAPVDCIQNPVVELLENAKILLNEGLLEEAKKTLRQILISFPGHVSARDMLDQIQDDELQQIFLSDEGPFVSRLSASKQPEVDSEELMKRLDQDLRLGVFDTDVPSVGIESFSLFQDEKAMEKFILKLEKDMVGATSRDLLDLGIAFLEMDLYSIAARLFKLDCSREGAPLAATALWALSLILLCKPFEAIAKMQPVLRNTDLKNLDKIEFFYLMGRAYEVLKEFPLASQFYQQVVDLDAGYRDSEWRLRKYSKK